ncbi:FHA domain protein [Rosistilla ulvae]|uniref:FHA domain protein n=1 Tax=Rosistilla ulvae TaxID=1930277 RepID=A0A517M8M2_9BACT|nr:FHA domain protein [Rosistilla ulvae]
MSASLPAGEAICPHCQSENKADAVRCVQCRRVLKIEIGPTAEPEQDGTDQPQTCSHCGETNPADAVRCSGCRRVLQSNYGPTQEGDQTQSAAAIGPGASPLPAFDIPTVLPPKQDELPPAIRKHRLALMLATIAVTGLLGFAFRIDRTARLQSWSDDCEQAFSNSGEASSTHWTTLPSGLVERVKVYLVADSPGDIQVASDLANRLPLEIVSEEAIGIQQWREATYPQIQESGGNHLSVVITNDSAQLRLAVLYQMRTQRRLPAFEYVASLGIMDLYGPILLLFSLCSAFAYGVDVWNIHQYRNQRRIAFSGYQAKRAQWLFQVQTHMARAEQATAGGDIETGKHLANEVLRVAPGFPDAVALLAEQQSPSDASSSESQTSANRLFSQLYLQVAGSPYAYHAPRSAKIVRVGRQRRKPGQGPEEGNDFVIRVPGSEAKTRKLSRQHLEIHRIGNDYFAIDRSAAGTHLNGRRLSNDQASLLATGDRLMIGGVLTLEVLIRREEFIGASAVQTEVEMTPYNNPGIVVDASVGDLVTIE